jgi:hypothetical protein
MSLPVNLHKKYLTRFNELISKGEIITKQIKEDKTNCNTSDISSEAMHWRTNCISILEPILQGNNAHRRLIEEFEKLQIGYFLSLAIQNDERKFTDHIKYDVERSMAEAVGKLKAIKDDFDNGFLANLSMQIEAEIAANYMGQAEQLLSEGQSGKYDHVPASVLTGAVLEKSLRTLCDQQTPPIHTFKTTAKGASEPLTLNPLIDELKKAAVFNELKAKQLRSWADIRNAAAHGEFDKFSRSDVEQMIEGVKNFLATYML